MEYFLSFLEADLFLAIAEISLTLVDFILYGANSCL